ncbi:TonB-dependent receptor [Aurantiacibacter xanthus]|uniref:TonB-dependent receptor n=1 Tax=Aurantiacibacter xanthus TaxID=1784712 RepID=A0A3A1P8D0_9SPHN|nr:TonB-dependent receptor [Aurantiacibacter xanthus]RIV89825.1 TonB-dependent receptor [Aurantiacibacter xanthus]
MRYSHMLGVATVFAIGQLAAPALAQERDRANEDDVIVVTVKSEPTALIDYPGAVTAIDQSELQARAIADISQLSYAAPNVALDTIGTFKGVANFAIRGLGINSSIASIDPAVGLFVDGVYLGVNAGTVFDSVDIARVDILRGPQGVAFGRNVTGGAVLVETGEPTDQWEGHARLAYEGPVDSGRGAGMWSARGVVSGPISDAVAIRLAALHSDDAGYFKNQFDGSNFGKTETTVLRGAIRARLSPAFTITAKGEYTDVTGDGAAGHNNGLFPRDTFDLSLDERGFHDSETGFAVVRAELELGEGKLTNIFGWRSYDISTRNDIDSSPNPIFSSDTLTTQEQFSNELLYSLARDGWRLSTGGYWFTQDVGYDEIRNLATPQFGGGKQKHDVLGLFGELGFDLTERLTLTAGLRWSREVKDAEVTYVRARPECSVIAGTCPITGERVPDENNGFADKRAWENWSPRLVASYAASEGARVYASWSRGYRSGGYNFRITQPASFEEVAAALGSPAYDEERVDTFELGAKWQSPGRAVFLQGAVFRSEVDNMQREVVVASATSGLAQSVYNTADARITGFEGEATVRAAPGLDLAANLGFIDADYVRVFYDISGDGAIDGADVALELPRAPRWTWGGSFTYEADLWGDKFVRAFATFQHRDRFAYSDNNFGYNDAANRVDATLAFGCRTCGITLSLFGRNLLDEVQFGGDVPLSFSGGPNSNGVDRPFDPHPAQGTFSPMAKGRVLGVALDLDF